MEAMDLRENVTIMVHDWGAQLGFTWANLNREAVKGIAHMQGVIGDFRWEHWPEKVQILFKRFRSPGGEDLVLGENYFVENILPAMTLRDLTEEEMNEYRRPYRNPGEDRRPTLTWPREIPIEGYPSDVLRVIEENNVWLARSPLRAQRRPDRGAPRYGPPVAEPDRGDRPGAPLHPRGLPGRYRPGARGMVPFPRLIP